MLSIAKVTIDFFDMLQAAKRNLTYPRYAWIMFGWYPDKWWTGAMARNNLSCSDEQLEVFIENARTVLIQHNPITEDVNGTTIAGIVRLCSRKDSLSANKQHSQWRI